MNAAIIIIFFSIIVVLICMKFFYNYSGLFFNFFFPLIQLTFFYLTVGGDPKGLVLGIVSDELISFSECTNTSLLTAVASEFTCDLQKISCRFIEELDDSIAIKVGNS